MTELVIGGAGVLVAALLGGATGFGFGLVATPSLLAAGIPLHEVVAVNLSLALLTRLIPAWQLRRHLVWRRARRLIAGSVPGILAGFAVRDAIDTDTLKIFAGCIALGAALALALRRPHDNTDPTAHHHSAARTADEAANGAANGAANEAADRATNEAADEATNEATDKTTDKTTDETTDGATDGAADRAADGAADGADGGGADGAVGGGPRPAAVVAAGVGGGFLGMTTSLNGVPPALLLTRDRVAQLPFIADMTVYFVAANTLTLALLAAGDPATLTSAGRYVLVWLPVGVLGNQLGVRSAGLLPYRVFRALTLSVVLVAGTVAVLGAL